MARSRSARIHRAVSIPVEWRLRVVMVRLPRSVASFARKNLSVSQRAFWRSCAHSIVTVRYRDACSARRATGVGDFAGGHDSRRLRLRGQQLLDVRVDLVLIPQVLAERLHRLREVWLRPNEARDGGWVTAELLGQLHRADPLALLAAVLAVCLVAHAVPRC